jgi:hypothetical protein
MPYEMRLQDGLVQVTFYGRFSSEDLMACGQDFFKLEADLEITPNRITDISAADPAGLDSVVLKQFAQARALTALKNRIKSAIVAGDALQYGLARMFQAMNENPQIQIVIFRDRESALQWLGAGPATDVPNA